jgi:hypothetical protein
MKTVADVLGVSRSNLAARRKGKSKPRGRYLKADDAELPICPSSIANGFIALWPITL